MCELAVSSAEPFPEVPDALAHRELRSDEFWRAVPAYAHLSPGEFHDHRFQIRNSVTSLRKLGMVLGDRVPESFYRDVAEGMARSTMSLRISPYILSLIDWENPYDDPLRIQFLPVGSRMLPDHPELRLDALNEREDSPVPGLVHRYFDRALFVALDTCPVYCRFCTRSYAVGLDTGKVKKLRFGAVRDRWDQVFAYVRSRPELEDVIVSGGDVAHLRSGDIERIGGVLLEIEHVRRVRFASRAPSVVPQKLVTDPEWVDALSRVVEEGRRRHKEVALHTHFNHPNEITRITRQGLDRLMERGITVRNQTVLQRGVNDDAATMQLLVRRLGFVNVHPYYVFVHDMVRGVEDLRTSLDTAVELEKEIRGSTAGYNTPVFVIDTMGGGGKRDVHSYEHYDRENGIAVFLSPAVRPGKVFFYFDPIDTLSAEARLRWKDGKTRREMIEAARRAALSGG